MRAHTQPRILARPSVTDFPESAGRPDCLLLLPGLTGPPPHIRRQPFFFRSMMSAPGRNSRPVRRCSVLKIDWRSAFSLPQLPIGDSSGTGWSRSGSYQIGTTQPASELVSQPIARIGCCVSPQPPIPAILNRQAARPPAASKSL
jgi:hypothetical protein